MKQVEQCFTRSHEAWAPLPLSKTKEESSKIFTVSKGNQFKVNPAMYKSGATKVEICIFQRVQDRDRVEPLAVGTFNLKSSIFTILGLACILCIFTPRFGLAHILKASYL